MPLSRDETIRRIVALLDAWSDPELDGVQPADIFDALPCALLAANRACTFAEAARLAAGEVAAFYRSEL